MRRSVLCAPHHRDPRPSQSLWTCYSTYLINAPRGQATRWRRRVGFHGLVAIKAPRGRAAWWPIPSSSRPEAMYNPRIATCSNSDSSNSDRHRTPADVKASQARADVDHSSTQCLSGFFASGFFAAGRSVHLTSRAEDEGSAPADLRRHLMVDG